MAIRHIHGILAPSPPHPHTLEEKEHERKTNLARDGRVSVALVSPDVAVSVTGRARVVRVRPLADDQFAILEIDVQQVKNDMAYCIVVETGIEIVPKERHRPWYDRVMAELEGMEREPER